ncbi:phage scaffolding protein [Methylobacter marinus]|uniref:phage scaffolding protein n=1 Tax=Methylobacter marinus TaxID=34058 RepID=UPI000382E9E9|nr:hypothetical protein [Methylobacter marinus]
MPEPATDPKQTTAADPGAGPTPPPAAPAVDVQAQINQALATQQAEFQRQLKEATGHSDFKSLTEAQLQAQGKLQELADAKAQEATAYKAKFEQTQISNALLSASTDAVDPGTVSALLAGKAACDDNGVVTIDGKPVAEAVKALLTEKPFLAKPQGGTGSGAPQAVADAPKADNATLSPQQRLAAARAGK